MIKVIFVQENGEVNAVCSPADDNLYTHGESYGECVAHVVPYDTDTSNISSWYWDGTDFKKDKPEYPGYWYFWENNTWVLDQDLLDSEIRGLRDTKLSNTDFTQLADSVLPSGTTAQDWAVYRQALRDVPQNNTNLTKPDNVIWPTKPGG